jgi:small GTP-binding protein
LEVCTHAGPGIRRLITTALESHGIAIESDVLGDNLWDRLAQATCPAAASWLLANPKISPVFNPVFLQRDAQILIAGPANAGKSTLINAWCGYERSIVHSAPGTTRDLLRVRVVHRGWGLDLIDSAGLRDTTEDLERSGQDLVLSRFQTADLVLWLDPVDAPPLDPPPAKNILRIQTKIDLRSEEPTGLSWSSKHPEGLETLADAVLACLGLPTKHDS